MLDVDDVTHRNLLLLFGFLKLKNVRRFERTRARTNVRRSVVVFSGKLQNRAFVVEKESL